MVNMLVRNERVERSVNRRCTGVEVERAVRIHSDHRIFSRSFGSAFLRLQIDRLQRHKLLLIQGSKILLRRSAQIAAGTLDPENFNGLLYQGVFVRDLGRRIPSACICNTLIRAQ